MIARGTRLAKRPAMRTETPLFSALLFAAATACSGSTTTGVGPGPAADTLFTTPEGDVTPDAIYGLWGGTLEDNGITFDTRWRFREDQLTLATRCSLRDGRESEVVSVTARARIDEDEITILESKKDEQRSGDFVCRANAQPRTIAACGDDGFERECFRLSGTSLTIYESPIEKLALVKLSD